MFIKNKLRKIKECGCPGTGSTIVGRKRHNKKEFCPIYNKIDENENEHSDCENSAKIARYTVCLFCFLILFN